MINIGALNLSVVKPGRKKSRKKSSTNAYMHFLNREEKTSKTTSLNKPLYDLQTGISVTQATLKIWKTCIHKEHVMPIDCIIKVGWEAKIKDVNQSIKDVKIDNRKK